MNLKKNKLKYLLLIPLLFVVLFQGLLPFCTLLMSGTKETLESNAVDINENIVDYRRALLENAAINYSNSVQSELTYLETSLADFLEAHGAGVEHFLADEALQHDFAQLVFPEFMEHLRYNNASGSFLILANSGSIQSENEYTGFFLRDSDPSIRSETNSDLMLERGDKQLARAHKLALDSSWSPKFSLLGSGKRSADNFFYTPYLLAQQQHELDFSSMGFWSTPFILEDHPLDNHQMITCSLPLVYDGVVCGVFGTEVSINYLRSNFLQVRELDRTQNAGYALAIATGGDEYSILFGKGALFDAVRRNGSVFTLENTEHEGLLRVKSADIGTQHIYAVCSHVSVYDSDSPYKNTDWVLCGFISEDSVFGLGRGLYNELLACITICALCGLLFMFFVVRGISQPVYRLMDSVRGGIDGLARFKPSNIQEVDELHHVVQSLALKELSAAKLLHEEKERYRISLSASNDIFFTYRQNEETVEIVNSGICDGTWPVSFFFQEVLCPLLRAEDVKLFEGVLSSNEPVIHTQINLHLPNDPDGMWIEINGSLVSDEHAYGRTVIGYARDISHQKLRELELEKDQLIDSLTSFCRLDYGIQQLSKARLRETEGMLVLLSISDFSHIVQKYGLVFGDVLLNEFSALVAAQCHKLSGEGCIFVRTDIDEFLLWLPRADNARCCDMLSALRGRFARLMRHGALELNFRAALAEANGELPTELLIERVKATLLEARRLELRRLTWEAGRIPELPGKAFTEVVYHSAVGHMGLASLVLNLFDKSDSLSAALDLTVLRLRRSFNLSDLLITAFDREYLSGVVDYCWKYPDTPSGIEPVYHCSEEAFRAMNRSCRMHTLQRTEDSAEAAAMLVDGLGVKKGVVFPMSDNGLFSGSIFFLGLDEAVLDDKDACELLTEIGTIIQNRINLDRHDQSARAKSDFLARMSHEIRTPMNGIIGMTEIALRNNQSREIMTDCLKKVRSSSDYLLRLLNDILEMSKIDSGKMTLLYSAFDMTALLDELRTVLDGELAAHAHALLTDISLKNRWFSGDSLRISQILINLLGNASKYSAPGTEIRLTVRETELGDGRSAVYFAVSDRGAGISAEDRQRIFGMFEQIENTASHRQGSGLGLAICSRLARMMGSEIMLDSELGKGSTFSFTLELPVAQAAPQTPPETADALDFHGVHVLAAEDNELNMEILLAFLEELGCTADCAYNGRQALEMFSASPVGSYSMIFMDVMMPEMDGLEATHRIRTLERPDSATVPIIAVSANAFDGDINNSLASGMNAHLLKPVEPAKLGQLMRQFLC